MRRELFRHLQKLPFSFFDEHKTGSIMSRMINDLFEVSELAHHGPENLFLSLIIWWVRSSCFEPDQPRSDLYHLCRSAS